jgi:hypothetical protein
MTPPADDLDITKESTQQFAYWTLPVRDRPRMTLSLSDHSYNMIRQTSAALFTTILYAGSRLKKPSLAPLLRSHAKMLCNRSIDQGGIGLGTIQALCLLVFLRDPHDSSWLSLGIAVRAAYQAGLHKSAGVRAKDDGQRIADLVR